jgi:eukaryotic-like serine/threonine-protein kinase
MDPRDTANHDMLIKIGDPDIDATCAHPGSDATEPVEERIPTFAPSTATSDGQRFRILRPHARGGLGAVFVALDEELHREVALKQILDHHADDPTSRTRFVLEAEITGGLEHPGIVPVYGLGSYGDGRPYYAMRFVRGESLKDAIASFHNDETLKADFGKRSLALRKLLRRFVDVCNAIDYAHTRGVLHRDIKPANVIVGNHGETLVVDWGLAKVLGRPETDSTCGERNLTPSSASGSAETLPGSVLGTPAYMSPEQASGDLGHLGVQSDVYSLGATLYCLLVGKPPFEGNDFAAILRAAKTGDFAPPRAAARAIDPALSAVCMKAMALEPKDRYVSCRSLADDVERWAADEPVSAWHEPLTKRALRWTRRHRTWLVAASAAAIMMLVGLGAVATVQAQANRDLKRHNSDLTAANKREQAARSQAEARFALARDAIEAYHTGASEDVLLKEPRLKDLRNKLLGSALGFYQKLQAVLEAEPGQAARAELASAYQRVGELDRQISSWPASREAYERALAIYTRLIRESPNSEEHQFALADAQLQYGRVLCESGLTSEGVKAAEQSRAIFERLVRDHPQNPKHRRALALAHLTIGSALNFWMGRKSEAFLAYQKGADVYQRLARDYPDVVQYQSGLAGAWYDLGAALTDSGRVVEGLRLLEQALPVQERLARDQPDVAEFQYTLGRALTSIGTLRFDLGRPADAMKSFKQSLSVYERLVRDHPTVTNYLSNQSGAQHSIGWLLMRMGRPAEALPWLRKALPVKERLASENPTVTDFHGRLAQSHAVIGDALREMGQLPEALPELQYALAIYERLAREHPAVEQYKSEVAGCHIIIASLLNQMRRYPESRREYQKAVDIYEKIATPFLGDVYNLGCAYARLAALSHPPGRSPTPEEESDDRAHADKAMATLRRAVALGYKSILSLRADPDLDALRSRADFRMLLFDAAFPDDPFAPSTESSQARPRS